MNKETISTKCCNFSHRNHKLSPYSVKFKYSTALNKEGHSNKFACWSNKRIRRELGLANTRSLGITNSPGVPAPSGDSACSRVCPITDTSISGAANLGINRDTDVDRETGNNHGPARSRGLCLSDIPGAQKGRGFSSGDKSEGFEQVYSRGALQDGGVSYGQGPGKTRGLVDQARPEGCLLSSAHRPQSPKISPVSMARSNIPVLLSPIWPILCPSHLHEVDETSSGFSEGEGNQTNHISGRPAVPGQLLEYPTQLNGVCQGLISDIESDHQRQEIPNGTGAGDSVSGFDSVNSSNASVITQREDGLCPTRGQATALKGRNISTEGRSLCGYDNSSKAGNLDCSFVSPTPTSSDKQSGATGINNRGSETELPPDNKYFIGSKGRARVVDARSTELQWCSNIDGPTQLGDRVTCILPGLGSISERSRAEDRWSVVTKRAGDAHQLPRATGSISSNSNICQAEEHECTDENGQHLGQGLHKPL